MARVLFACIALLLGSTLSRGADGYPTAPAIVISGRALVAESIASDGMIVSNETLTYSMTLSNAGTRPAQNVSVTIVETNGIVPIAATHYIGTFTTNQEITLEFTFRVDSPPGRVIQVQMPVLSDSAEISRNVFDVAVGTNTVTATRFRNLYIPSEGPANEYPSTITFSNLVGSITGVRVTLHNFAHVFPEDVNVVLVSPSGTVLLLMSDVGGYYMAYNANITFATGRTNLLTTLGYFDSGTYAATDYNLPNYMPEPGPTNIPTGLTLNAFNKEKPNGDWKLYIADVRLFDEGNLLGGWSLSLTLQPPPTLLISNRLDGRVQVTVQNTGKRSFLIDSTSTMTNWTVLGQTPANVDHAVFYDSIPTNGVRFYRARRVSE